MLTLIDPLTIHDNTVYRDHADPKRFYVLPATFTVVDRDRTERIGVLAPGHALLTLTLDAGGMLPLDAIRARLPPGSDARPAPLSAGRVTLTAAGAPPIVLGSGALLPLEDAAYAVMIEVAPDGAALLADPKRLSSARLDLGCEAELEHRVAGAALSADGDGWLLAEILRALQERGDPRAGGSAGDLANLFVDCSMVPVRLRSIAAPIDDATQAVAERFAVERIGEALAALLAASPPAAGALAAWASGHQDELGAACSFAFADGDLARKACALSGAIATIDPGRFAAADSVVVRAPVDFGRFKITAVELALHDAKGDQTFKLGGSADVFIAPITGDTYDWTATVHFQDVPAPQIIKRAGARDRRLLLDAAALGVMAVGVSIGRSDFKRFSKATVSLRYASTALNRFIEASLTLDSEHPDAQWIAPVGEAPGGYQYKVDRLRSRDQQIVPGAWTDGAGAQLRIDTPPFDGLSVLAAVRQSIFETAEFVTVELRYDDPANNYKQEGVIQLTRNHSSQSWEVELRNPALRTYQYRVSLIMRDAELRTDGVWNQTTDPFVAALSDYADDQVAVNLFCMCDFDAPGAPLFATVDFRAIEPRLKTVFNRSFAFSKGSNRATFSLGDWFARPYSLDVTYYTPDGKTIPTFTTMCTAILIPPPPISNSPTT